MTSFSALLAIVSVGQGTGPSMDSSVALLKSLKPGMTLEEVRSKLPKGTVVSSRKFVPPVDGQLTGSVFRLSGKVQGSLSFLRAEQIRAIRNSAGRIPQDYRASDPIHAIQLSIHSSKTYSKSTGETLVARLTKSLGKPTKAAKFEPEWMNDFGGWSASWRVGGRTIEFYEFQGTRYESRLEMILGETLYP